MNRDDYEKLVNPYSFELRNIYDDTFGHRRHLEDMLGVRSPFQSAVERAASGLEDATRLDAISGPKTLILEELERISGITRRVFLGDGIYAGVMSHAEEMAKIQERIFPERSALAAAAGLSDAISKSLSGMGNVGLDDDVFASLTGSTSKMTRQLNRDLHLGINESIFGRMANIDKLFEDQMASTRDMISGFAKPSSLSLAALTAREMAPRGAVADIFKQIINPLALERHSLFENSLKGLAAFDGPEIKPEILAGAIIRAHDKVEESKEGGMSLETVMAWMTFLMLLMALWNAYMQHEMWQMENENTAASEKLNLSVERIEKSASDISKTLRQKANDQSAVRYIHKDAVIRTEPNKEAQELRYIYPDQLIRVVDTKGHWAKVEILDYRTEKRERGWIARSQLRIEPLD